MFRNVKLFDILTCTVAIIGLIYGMGARSRMDIMFSVLLAMVVNIVMARFLYIESKTVTVIRMIVRAVFQIMAITTVFGLFIGGSYFERFLTSAVGWSVFVNVKVVDDKLKDNEKSRDKTWKYYEYKKMAGGNRTEDYTQNAKNSETRGEKMTPFQKSQYYKDCTNEEELKDKYRDLVKMYHPDNNDGDAEMFVQINNEYEELLEYVEGTNGKEAKAEY